jgi:putative transposase
MSFLDGNSEVLERLVTEMYARGLSPRDVEDAFRDSTSELLISRSAVSEITDRLWEQYQEFIARDLSEVDVEYVLVDAVTESLRRHGSKEAAGRLAHRFRRPQTSIASGRRQQGVRGLLE